jgi:hypothetical protein
MQYLYWLLATIAGIVISAIIIHIAAVIIGPSDRGFGAAFMSALLMYIIGHIIIIPLIFLTSLVIPYWVFMVISFLVALFVIHRVYSTAFVSAFGMWLISAVFNAVYSLLFYGPLIVDTINAIRVAGGRTPL